MDTKILLYEDIVQKCYFNNLLIKKIFGALNGSKKQISSMD